MNRTGHSPYVTDRPVAPRYRVSDARPAKQLPQKTSTASTKHPIVDSYRPSKQPTGPVRLLDHYQYKQWSLSKLVAEANTRRIHYEREEVKYLVDTLAQNDETFYDTRRELKRLSKEQLLHEAERRGIYIDLRVHLSEERIASEIADHIARDSVEISNERLEEEEYEAECERRIKLPSKNMMRVRKQFERQLTREQKGIGGKERKGQPAAAVALEGRSTPDSGDRSNSSNSGSTKVKQSTNQLHGANEDLTPIGSVPRKRSRTTVSDTSEKEQPLKKHRVSPSSLQTSSSDQVSTEESSESACDNTQPSVSDTSSENEEEDILNDTDDDDSGENDEGDADEETSDEAQRISSPPSNSGSSTEDSEAESRNLTPAESASKKRSRSMSSSDEDDEDEDQEELPQKKRKIAHLKRSGSQSSQSSAVTRSAKSTTTIRRSKIVNTEDRLMGVAYVKRSDGRYTEKTSAAHQVIRRQSSRVASKFVRM